MTRPRDLAIPMPPVNLRELRDLGEPGGPCTPSPFEIKSLAYGRPPALPTSISNGSVASDCSVGTEASASTAASDEPQTPASALAGLALSSCDVTPLSSPIISPPSATVTGKRHRDEWTMDEVQLLENVLARPPPDLHFPPGSMPPPEVLDGLTSALLETLGHEDTPGSAIAIDIDCSSIDAWPHSWDVTRHKLAALALSETRLGAELANRKLTRQERLARPGIKRVGSMDYLDDEEHTMPSERIGRVLRLSTTLQNSARGAAAERPPTLIIPTPAPRAASLGAPARPEQPSLVRTSSSLSVSSAGSMSRRPSLLARGRSFTAEDLEGENGESIVLGRGLTAPPEELKPVAPLPAAENTPAVAVSSPSPPEEPAPKRVSLGRSKSYGPSPRDAQARRDSFLAPPMPAPPRVLALDESPAPSPTVLGEGLGLGGAFEWAAPSRTPSGWESDSDRECPRTRRKMRGTLAMTALNAATRERSSSLSSGSGSGSGSSRSRSRSASLSASDGASTPPLVLSAMVDEAARAHGGALRSPFEEKQLELP